jgi:hypothetical protein
MRSYIFHKSFVLGFFVAVGVLSSYIFGEDNLAEELSELFIFKTTGIFVDFTPKSEEETAKDFHDILELSRESGWRH